MEYLFVCFNLFIACLTFLVEHPIKLAITIVKRSSIVLKFGSASSECTTKYQNKASYNTDYTYS